MAMGRSDAVQDDLMATWGNAALARTRVLRSLAGPASGSWVRRVLIIVLRTEAALVFALIATVDGELAAIVIVAADPTRN